MTTSETKCNFQHEGEPACDRKSSCKHITPCTSCIYSYSNKNKDDLVVNIGFLLDRCPLCVLEGCNAWMADPSRNMQLKISAQERLIPLFSSLRKQHVEQNCAYSRETLMRNMNISDRWIMDAYLAE